MNKKTTVLAAVMLGIVAVSGTALAFASPEDREAVQNAIASNDYEAFKEAVNQELTEEQFNQMVDAYQNREAVNNALENGDYEAWKAAVQEMQQTRLQNMLTEENFERMMEMHQAMENGEYGECARGDVRPMERMGMGWGMMG